MLEPCTRKRVRTVLKGGGGGNAASLLGFGDSWEHEVSFEGIEAAEAGHEYPQCTGGSGNCPPEDCGGPGGFADFLKAMSNKKHPEHKSYVEWIGGTYDPHKFDPQSIHFDDPKKRLKAAFLG